VPLLLNARRLRQNEQLREQRAVLHDHNIYPKQR
jgi:hypothetical protein